MGHLSHGQLKVTITTDRSLRDNLSAGTAPNFASHEQTFGGRDSLDFSLTEEASTVKKGGSPQRVVASALANGTRTIHPTGTLESALKPQTSAYIAQTIERIEGAIS